VLRNNVYRGGGSGGGRIDAVDRVGCGTQQPLLENWYGGERWMSIKTSGSPMKDERRMR